MFHSLNELNVWCWLGVGIILLGIELCSNKAYYFLAALISGFVGLLQAVFGIVGITQCLVFLIVTSLVEYGWFKLRQSQAILHRDSQDNYAIAKMVIGKTATLSKATHGGCGKVLLDDRLWHIRCSVDLPAGTVISVTGHDGVILYCKKAEALEER